MLDEAAGQDPDSVLEARLDRGERIPGFGHAIYRRRDPRLEPLLRAVRRLPDPAQRMATVDALLLAAGTRLARHPNVDVGLGALTYGAGLPADAPLFAIARIAGWTAHRIEELAERPIRYRGLGR